MNHCPIFREHRHREDSPMSIVEGTNGEVHGSVYGLGQTGVKGVDVVFV